MNELELAWAAGFFGGEGNAYRVTHRGRWSYLRMQVAQKERGPLERFASAVGCGNVTGPYANTTPSGEPSSIFRWGVQGKNAAAVADLLLPYLSAPKCEQIRAAKESE